MLKCVTDMCLMCSVSRVMSVCPEKASGLSACPSAQSVKRDREAGIVAGIYGSY